MQIIDETERGGVQGFSTAEEREQAIAELRQRGFNYFQRYKDTGAEYAVFYGRTQVEKPVPLAPPSWQPKPGNRGYDLMH